MRSCADRVVFVNRTLHQRRIFYVSESIRPLDLMNVMLGAILGAVIGNSEAFHPTDAGQIFHCVMLIFLIVGFAMNCQWTTIAFEKKRPGFALVFFLLFIGIELFLISSNITVQRDTNDIVSLQLRLRSGTNLWVLCITFAALYALNVAVALKRSWFEGKR